MFDKKNDAARNKKRADAIVYAGRGQAKLC